MKGRTAYELRRRTLDFWRHAPGEPVRMQMAESTVCGGLFAAVDSSQSQMHVRHLQTRIGTYPCATLRTTDLLAVEFEAPWILEQQHTPPAVDSLAVAMGQADAAAQGETTCMRVECVADTAAPGTDVQAELDARKRALLLTLSACEDLTLHDGVCSARGEGPATAARAGRSGGDMMTSREPAIHEDSKLAEAAGWDGRQRETHKYWRQRYKLFSKFDHGIQLDREGWFSVTPEAIARHIANRCQCDLIIDAFAGVGGNAIQFAFTCCHVIAIDIDAKRLQIARNNARVYGVADRIDFVHGDFLALAPSLKADVVFLSPPWGGPDYKAAQVFDLDSMMGGLDGAEILRAALRAAPNVGYYLPKNVGMERVEELAEEAGVALQTEPCYASNGQEKALMAYYGFEEEAGDTEEEEMDHHQDHHDRELVAIDGIVAAVRSKRVHTRF